MELLCPWLEEERLAPVKTRAIIQNDLISF